MLLDLFVGGYAKEVVTFLFSESVVVSSDTARIFQTLVVAMSRFDFISSCVSLVVDLSTSYLVGSSPVLVGVPLFPSVA